MPDHHRDQARAVQSISVADFESTWATSASIWLKQRIAQRDLRYLELTTEQRDRSIIDVLQVLDAALVRTGAHRIDDWERGWGENLAELSADSTQAAIVPKYFGKIPIIRWQQRWIEPVDRDLEYAMLSLLLDWVADEYLEGFDAIYEFGCGTGHNLARLRERFADVKLTGLDWARSSQGVVQAFAENTGDTRLFAANFDYFNPDQSLDLDPNSAVLTIASLEQTGTDYRAFISYLIQKKPSLVVNVEPIGELLDAGNLLDYLSLRYFEKRRYLHGYLDYLRELQGQGVIEILDSRRSFVGSFFIDGYSLVVWKPASHDA